MRQRGIPLLVVTWLLDFGRAQYDHHGAVVHYFDKQSRRTIEHLAGRQVVARLAECLNCYAVRTLNGKLITVGHRQRRFHLN